jgi:hypothetical protein
MALHGARHDGVFARTGPHVPLPGAARTHCPTKLQQRDQRVSSSMCGRAAMAMAPEDVEAAACRATGMPGKPRWRDADRYKPSYNVQPGAWTPVLRLNSEDKQPEIQTMS